MRIYWIISFLISIFIFQPTEANTGLPTIVMFEPLLIVTLVPVILVEYKVMQRYLKGKAENSILLKSVSIANLCSTFVGFPITWIIMALLQEVYEKIIPLLHVHAHEVPFEPAWLVPIIALWEGEKYTLTMRMMIGFSLLFVLAAHFFMSWWSEYFVNSKIIPKTECKAETTATAANISTDDIMVATRNANLVSYAFLVLVTVAIWCYKFHNKDVVCGGFQLINVDWLWSFSFETVSWIRLRFF
jgi:hypothetical protein